MGSIAPGCLGGGFRLRIMIGTVLSPHPYLRDRQNQLGILPRQQPLIFDSWWCQMRKRAIL